MILFNHKSKCIVQNILRQYKLYIYVQFMYAFLSTKLFVYDQWVYNYILLKFSQHERFKMITSLLI